MLLFAVALAREQALSPGQALGLEQALHLLQGVGPPGLNLRIQEPMRLSRIYFDPPGTDKERESSNLLVRVRPVEHPSMVVLVTLW